MVYTSSEIKILKADVKYEKDLFYVGKSNHFLKLNSGIHLKSTMKTVSNKVT